MTRKVNNHSVGKTAVLLSTLANAVVVKYGLIWYEGLYWLLLITVPLWLYFLVAAAKAKTQPMVKYNDRKLAAAQGQEAKKASNHSMAGVN